MIQLLKQIFSFLTSWAGFAEKAVKPEEVRIRNNEIKEPLKEEAVREKLEDGIKVDWVAKVKTLIGPSARRKRIVRHVKRLIEWGARIDNIIKEDRQIIILYRYNEKDLVDSIP